MLTNVALALLFSALIPVIPCPVFESFEDAQGIPSAPILSQMKKSGDSSGFQTRLSTGLWVSYVRDPNLSTMETRLRFAAGDLPVSGGKRWTFLLASHLLLEGGTTTQTHIEVAQALEGKGVFPEGTELAGELEYRTNCLPGDFEITVGNVANLVRFPVVRPGRFLVVKDGLKMALRTLEEKPLEHTEQTLVDQIQGDGYGGRRAFECLEKTEAPAVAVVQRELLRPGRAIMLITGPLDLEKVARLIESAFLGWVDPELKPSLEPAVVSPEINKQNLGQSSNGLTYLTVGYKLPPDSDSVLLDSLAVWLDQRLAADPRAENLVGHGFWRKGAGKTPSVLGITVAGVSGNTSKAEALLEDWVSTWFNNRNSTGEVNIASEGGRVHSPVEVAILAATRALAVGPNDLRKSLLPETKRWTGKSLGDWARNHLRSVNLRSVQLGGRENQDPQPTTKPS